METLIVPNTSYHLNCAGTDITFVVLLGHLVASFKGPVEGGRAKIGTQVCRLQSHAVGQW